jgi:hypothetical protein
MLLILSLALLLPLNLCSVYKPVDESNGVTRKSKKRSAQWSSSPLFGGSPISAASTDPMNIFQIQANDYLDGLLKDKWLQKI